MSNNYYKPKLIRILFILFDNVTVSFVVTGFLKGDDLQIRGSVKIGGDCTVETFDSKGGFGIAGLLNASEENYGYLQEDEIYAYVKYYTFRIENTRKFKKNIFKKENFKCKTL
jgi:hypothetical protein